MTRSGRAQNYLSDFQEFILANLKKQTMLEAELARMNRSTTAGQKLVFAARMAQLRADLAGLRVAMNLRRQQENPDSSRTPRAQYQKASAPGLRAAN